ncbi:MAG: Flp pilus assembly protein CpaB [Sphingomonadales bacterium]|nr:Flp pilus assembly protein CpaB [Sphingomonadales bacterium]
MNLRSIILVVVALAVAGATALLTRSWLGANRPQQVVAAPAPVQPTVKVLVARNNLPIGRILEAEDMRWQSWPDGNLPDSYIINGKGTLEAQIGKVVRHGIVAGDPVTTGRIVGPGQRGFMAAILSPGMRAVTVPITATSGIAGFIFPGDRVDLILTHEVGDTNGRTRQVSETVMRNVRILAVDRRTNDQTNQPALGKTVTIEVTPKIAEKISVLRRVGQISLSLRSLARADGERADALSQEEILPEASGFTHTWDAEVSGLLPPVEKDQGVHTVTVSRGKAQQNFKFKKVEE